MMKTDHIHFLFTILLLLIQTNVTFGQLLLSGGKLPDASLSGRVILDDKKPIPGANILLTSKFDSGSTFCTLTDEEGCFKISIPVVVYKIAISYTGFQTYKSYVSLTVNTRVPDIVLNERKETFLQEVSVVAQSVTYDAKGYKVNVIGNELMKEQSLDNVIRMLPGVVANLESIQLYDREVMAVYINDRKVSLYGKDLQDYLKTFKGDQIKSIQAIASSGVEEDASVLGKASLRIYTTKQDDGGRLSVGISGRRKVGNYHWQSPSMNLQWRLGKWSAYVNASGSYHERGREKRMDYTDYTDTGNTQNASVEIYTLENQLNEVFGIGYDFNKNHQVTLEQSFRYKQIHSDKFLHTLICEKGIPIDSERGTWNGKEKNIRHMVSGMYIYSFDSGRLETSVSYTNFDSDGSEMQAGGNSQNSHIYTGENSDNQKYILYYADVRLHKSVRNEMDKLVAGLAGTGWNRKNQMEASRLFDGIPEEYGNYSDLYRYKEQVYAAYASYDWRYKKWNILAGVRLEHLILDPHSYINPERNKSSSYTNLFPNVAMNYVINQNMGHNVNVEYSRTIERPMMAFMNPAIHWSNEYNYSMGNPYLTPNYANKISLRMNLFNHYTLTVGYGRSEQYQSIYGKEPGSDITYSTTVNGGRSERFSLGTGVSYNLLAKCMINFSASYGWGRSRYNGASVQNDGWGCSLSVMGELPLDISVFVNSYYRSPYRDVYTRNSHMLVCMSRISRSFLKEQLEVSLSANILGNPYAHITVPYYTYNTHGAWNSYSLTLSLQYTIKWGNKRSYIRQNFPKNTNELMRMGNE